MDAAEIDALTYNDVRRACKDVGIPAKGKLVDLREALKAHYGSTESVPSRGEEPSSGGGRTTAASVVSRAKDGVMKKVDDLQSFLEEKKATQQTGKERSVEVLNRAVLNAVLGLDEKSPDWGSIVSSLDDIWSFRKVSRNNKANVAMFVCTDATS
eukprot:jgi/Picre1/28188/NNA_003594.t1